MLIRFCGIRAYRLRVKLAMRKSKLQEWLVAQAIKILFVAAPPVFNPIREPAPVFRVGGGIPTPTGQTLVLIKLHSQLRDLTATQDQPHFPVFMKKPTSQNWRYRFPPCDRTPHTWRGRNGSAQHRPQKREGAQRSVAPVSRTARASLRTHSRFDAIWMLVEHHPDIHATGMGAT